MIRNKASINKDILLSLGFDKILKYTFFTSYANKRNTIVLIYKDRIEVYKKALFRVFKPDNLSDIINSIKEDD